MPNPKKLAVIVNDVCHVYKQLYDQAGIPLKI